MDREIVIKLPEEEYEEIINSEDCGLHTLTRAIANGTPLPKGHGRLIDADAIWDLYHDNDYDFYEALDDAPTIIEAEKGEEK